MDPRIEFVERKDGPFKGVSALGKVYPDLVTAERETSKIIEVRERAAGRTLTPMELFRGVQHREDRDTRQRIEDDQWKPTTFVSDVEKAPWYDDPIHRQAKGPGSNPGKESRKDLFARAKREAETAEATKAHRDSPETKAAIEYADSIFEAVNWDSTVPQSMLVAAERLQKQARGDLDTFKAMASEFVESYDLHRQQRVEAIEVERRKAQAAIDSLPGGLPVFGADQPPSPNLGPGERYMKYHDGSVSHLRESDGQTYVLKTWQADDVPSDVAETL